MAAEWSGSDPADRSKCWTAEDQRDGVYRFAVGDGPNGRRSFVWRVWTRYRSSDIYIAAQALGGLFKVSLHGSGHWQAAFVAESGFKRPEDERIPHRWTRPEEVLPGWTRAFEVWIPDSELAQVATAPRERFRRVKWFSPLPPLGDPTSIFSIWISGPDVLLDTDDWPILDGYANDLLTRFPLASGETVWIVRVSCSLLASHRENIEALRAAAFQSVDLDLETVEDRTAVLTSAENSSSEWRWVELALAPGLTVSGYRG